jgi:hypothetical protein
MRTVWARLVGGIAEDSRTGHRRFSDHSRTGFMSHQQHYTVIAFLIRIDRFLGVAEGL